MPIVVKADGLAAEKVLLFVRLDKKFWTFHLKYLKVNLNHQIN